MKEAIIAVLSAIAGGSLISFFFKRSDQKKNQKKEKLDIVLKELCSYNLVLMNTVQTHIKLLTDNSSILSKINNSSKSLLETQKVINIDLSKVEAIKTKCEQGEQNCDECKIICDRIKSNDTAFNDWKETCDRDKSIVAQKNKEEVERLIKVIQPFSSLLNKIPELYSINSSHLYDLIGTIDLNTTKALTKLIKNSNDTEKLSIKSMSDAIDILTEQMRSIEDAKLEISNMLK